MLTREHEEEPDYEHLLKVMKMMKNCIIRAYSRATEPALFELVASKVLYAPPVKRMLISLVQDSPQIGQYLHQNE